ncbi:MAG TPA: cytochrome c family protein [Caulobacteraceae bacterium]|jgi:cytochrome c|nr:cytochrome c family protein [Caulobacteraceae bacterium]
MTSRVLFVAAVAFAAALSACGPKKDASASADQSTSEATVEPDIVTPQDQAMVATLPAPFNTGDPVNGKRIFARCRACHTVEKDGPNMIGPNLWGLFGRKAGSKSDYGYSDAMKAQGYAWDAAHLDKWLTSPATTVPGTKMTFIGLDKAQDRNDVIAYLKTATEPKPKVETAPAKPAKK